MLKIALSKDILKYKDVTDYMVNCGIDINFNIFKDRNILTSKKFPAEVLTFNEKEVLESLNIGMQDVAIIREHLLLEHSKNFDIVYNFEENKSDLSIFVPKDFRYKDLSSLSNKKIATSSPELLRKFLKMKKIRAVDIVYTDNPQKTVEIGFADFFVDIQTDVDSLFYFPIETIASSSIVMVASPVIELAKRHIFLEELLSRMKSVANAHNKIKVQIICKIQHKNNLIDIIRKLDEDMIALSTYNQKKMLVIATIDEMQLWDIKHYLEEIEVDKITVEKISNIIFYND